MEKPEKKTFRCIPFACQHSHIRDTLNSLLHTHLTFFSGMPYTYSLYTYRVSGCADSERDHKIESFAYFGKSEHFRLKKETRSSDEEDDDDDSIVNDEQRKEWTNNNNKLKKHTNITLIDTTWCTYSRFSISFACHHRHRCCFLLLEKPLCVYVLLAFFCVMFSFCRFSHISPDLFESNRITENVYIYIVCA